MSYRSNAPLPDDVIDRLFTALVVRYGAPFTDRWRDLDLNIVKGDWARELRRYANDLGAIAWALERLPEKPPTVIDFRKLCDAAPPKNSQAMISDDSKVRGPNAAELAKLAELRARFAREPAAQSAPARAPEGAQS